MSSSSHSIASSASTSKALVITGKGKTTRGSCRVRYDPESDWDFCLHSLGHDSPVDVDLILPHFRATNQPVDHRLNMYVGNEQGAIKTKVCRSVSRTKFYLEVRGGVSDVTLYLPSDFKGQIRMKAKGAYFSPGFANCILPHTRINKNVPDFLDEDRVVISTRGTVTLKMWDILTGAPEHMATETIRKIFGYSRRSPSPASDGEWDFLLE